MNPILPLLNRALELEWAQAIQYQRQALVLGGPWRAVYAPMFGERARAAMRAARRVGEQIVALGGEPSITPAPLRRTTSLEDMLAADLELACEALRAYMDAWSLCEGQQGMRLVLERAIQLTERQVNELTRLARTTGAEASRCAVSAVP